MKSLINRLRRTREDADSGSVLLESVIVLPLVFIVIFALIFAALWLCDAAVVDSAVRRGAVYASRLISDPQYQTVTESAELSSSVPDFNYGQYTFSKRSSIEPYRYLDVFDNEHKDEVIGYITGILNYSSFGASGITLDSIEYNQHNYILYQDVTIKINISYKLPEIFEKVGISDVLSYSAQATMVVNDPDEFIRNTDFVADLLSDLLERLTGNKNKNSLGDTLKDELGKIFSFKDKFFK